MQTEFLSKNETSLKDNNSASYTRMLTLFLTLAFPASVTLMNNRSRRLRRGFSSLEIAHCVTVADHFLPRAGYRMRRRRHAGISDEEEKGRHLWCDCQSPPAALGLDVE